MIAPPPAGPTLWVAGDRGLAWPGWDVSVMEKDVELPAGSTVLRVRTAEESQMSVPQWVLLVSAGGRHCHIGLPRFKGMFVPIGAAARVNSRRAASG